MYLEIKVI